MVQKSLANSLVLVMVFSLVATSLAQENTATDTEIIGDEEVIEDAGILPGNPFYFVKEWGRGLRRMFIFDPFKRVEYESDVVDEKAGELEALTELFPEREEAVQKAFQNYEGAMERLRARIEALGENANNARVEELLAQLAERRERHEELFLSLQEQFGSLGEKAEQIRANWDETIRPAFEGIENMEQFRERVMQMAEEGNPAYGNLLRYVERYRLSQQESESEDTNTGEEAGEGGEAAEESEIMNPEGSSSSGGTGSPGLLRPITIEINPNIIVDELVPSLQKVFRLRTSKYDVVPSACAEIYAPVCGDDGETYSNECFATVAGVDVASEGECPEEDTSG